MNQKKFSIVESLRFGFLTAINNIIFFLSVQGILALILIAGALAILGILYLFWSAEVVMICKGADISCFQKYGSLQGIITFFKSLAATDPETNEKTIRAALNKSYFMIPGIIVCSLIMSILYRYVTLGMVRICLDFYDHHTSSFNRLFGSFSLALKAFVASLLYNFMIVLGTLLFIIPGIIAAIRFGFYQQVLVDKNVGIIDSLKLSAQITKGSALSVFAVNLIFGLINISAYFTFGITYIITFPALYLAQAYMYRKLLAAPETREENH